MEFHTLQLGEGSHPPSKRAPLGCSESPSDEDRSSPSSPPDHRDSRADKGKGRAAQHPSHDLPLRYQDDEDDEDDDGEGSEQGKRAVPGTQSTRSARKIRRTTNLKKAIKYVHIPPAPPPRNPSSELLQSIHHHTSRFYTSHSLLLEPKKRQRAAPYPNKKRIDIANDFKSPYAEDMGRSLDAPKSRNTRGRVKVRDMHRALEGEGLMAIGVLVQEHIIRHLQQAGYEYPGSGLLEQPGGSVEHHDRSEGSADGEEVTDDES